MIYFLLGVVIALLLLVLHNIRQVHGLVNSKHDEALQKIDLLKDEIVRLNRGGIITRDKRSGPVTLSAEGVVSIEDER